MHPVDQPQLQVILQIAAHPFQPVPDADAQAFEQTARPYAGALQQGR